MFVAIRLSVCALALVSLMAVLRRSWRPLGEWRWLHCAIAGALINAIGLMAPHVGFLLAPAAQIALVQSLTPLLTAVLGVSGVALVVGLAALESPTRLEGLLLAFLGVLGLVAGTLYFGRFCRGVPVLPGATAQFLAAAAVSALGAATLETPRVTWTAATIAAVAWNTIAVSLGGMALYFFMLTRGTVARTTANFYLVPGAAAVLGWIFLGERLSPLAVLGLVVASLGCWLVNAWPQPSARRGISGE